MSLEPHSSNFPPSDPSPGPSASPFSAISPSLPTTTSTYAYSQPAYALGTTLGIAANLNAALQLWKSFNYSDAQRGMDSTAAEMASKQDESEASRRRLVELSREFKTKTPEEVRRAVAPLLKQFQSEIDTLTRRCKSAESAFLSLYKQLIDLPDPVPLLEHANAAQKRAQRVTDLEIENKQLRDTLEQYNTEFAHVRNQEITVKQLRERLRETEERVEATVRERVKEREQQLARQLADREAQAQERESDLLQQLNDAKHQNTTLQHALESSQNELMDVRTKYEELLAGKLAEIEMLAADVEKSAERAAAAEQQLERVRRQQQQQSAPSSLGEGDESALALGGEALASAEGRPAGSSLTLLLQERQERLARLELELSTKDRTIAQLVADVQRAESALARLRDATAIQGAKVQSELSARNQRIAELEQRIAAQSDYSEVKRELEIFKAVEFGSSEASDAGGSSIMTESSFTPSPAHSSSATSGIPLEQLVLRKNKTLQAQLVQLKSDHAKLQGFPM